MQARAKLAVEVDLGVEGEPKGPTRLNFAPLLPRSRLMLAELRVPLGMVGLRTRPTQDCGASALLGSLPS